MGNTELFTMYILVHSFKLTLLHVVHYMSCVLTQVIYNIATTMVCVAWRLPWEGLLFVQHALSHFKEDNFSFFMPKYTITHIQQYTLLECYKKQWFVFIFPPLGWQIMPLQTQKMKISNKLTSLFFHFKFIALQMWEAIHWCQ